MMDQPDILKYLKALPEVTLEAGSDIHDYLRTNDLLAVLKAGTVELASATGKTRITLEPGAPLGILRRDQDRPLGSLVAITECAIIPLDEENVATLVEFNPRFTRDLLGVMVDAVRRLVQHLP